MTGQQLQRLENLAEDLTRRLGIPFKAAGNGSIGFRERLRVTDWAVPLMFDGHVARDDDALFPVDTVGHLLWPALRSTRSSTQERAWWHCRLSPTLTEAIVEALEEDSRYVDGIDERVIGRDVLLEDAYPVSFPTSSPASSGPETGRPNRRKVA